MASPAPSEATTPPTFGIISEGPADFTVIRFVLAGYFDDPDLEPRQLQPLDGQAGGWTEVLRFLESDKFLPALEYNRFLIVHIDTDCCEEVHFGVARKVGDHERSPAEMIAAVRERLIAAIGREKFAAVAHRIIFAIAVESTECWLLPLYWNDNRKGKTTNCLGTLNEQLAVKEKFTIDVERKNVKYYQRIAKPLRKPKILRQTAIENPSFKVFLDNLEAIFGSPGSADATAVASG